VPQNPQDTTNPGSTNVADQGDGVLSVDQCVETGPSSNPSADTPSVAGGGLGGSPITTTNPGTTNVADEAFGIGLPRNVNVG
jgi:hypothetical protein